MSAAGAGELGEAQGGDASKNRHPWMPPRVRGGDPIAEGRLMMRNTLTGKKEVFVPTNGRQVRWYQCGPTVYDSAHVGHARNYLSFDIIRRIMTDYFMYNVLYHVNVTDIDDKIIKRARQNFLMAQLEEDKAMDFAALVPLVDVAVVEVQEKIQSETARWQEAEAAAKAAADGYAQVKAEEELKVQARLQENLAGDAANIEEAKATGDREKLLEAARSVLSSKLDREKGDSVTDHSVFNTHARKYEREFMEDMKLLGIRDPDVLTRVTEYVPEIIAFVEKIIAKGMAYESGGSVYLSLEKFGEEHNYRKLSPATSKETSDADMEESEGTLGDVNAGAKRHKNDFALWKASKPGEPAWDSPWGMGRPGWHIECSVVASDILGERLDIHTGGEDLKFPHHDNELAQSEACFGSQQWVNYFMHAGHLHIQGLKMSKSLKNFITIREALNRFTAAQMRILFLLSPYDEQLSFSDQTVDDARAKEKTLKAFFRTVETISVADYLAEPVGWRNDGADAALAQHLLDAQDTVHDALLDNFDTRTAFLTLLDLVAKSNAYINEPGAKPCRLLLRRIAGYITFMLRVFGVAPGADDIGFKAESNDGASKRELVGPVMDSLVSFREKIREAALGAADKSDPAIAAILRACDAVRDDDLVRAGVRLEDGAKGATWTLEDPEELMRERAENLEREQAAAREKYANKAKMKEKEVEKCRQAMVDPNALFRTDEFSAWDDDGLPTALKDGTALSDGQRKKKKKLQDKQAKLHADALAAAGGDLEGHLQSLLDELEALRAKASA